jgi:hypothetical protein
VRRSLQAAESRLEEVERVADPQAARARLASLENDLVEGMSTDGWASNGNTSTTSSSCGGNSAPGKRSMASLMTEITSLR